MKMLYLLYFMYACYMYGVQNENIGICLEIRKQMIFIYTGNGSIVNSQKITENLHSVNVVKQYNVLMIVSLWISSHNAEGHIGCVRFCSAGDIADL